MQLNKNKSDLILKFKLELLHSFMQRHRMSIYRDLSSIKNGDAIIIKHKRQIFAYDVVDIAYPNVSIRLVKFIKGDTPTGIKTIKISEQNFILGIRLDKDILNINSKSFFFFITKHKTTILWI